LGLTRRELEVLSLAAEGNTNQQIAQCLDVGTQTVKFHLSNVYRKLGVRTRTAAARRLDSVILRDTDRG
jgi:DNA-binding CsgD family transcriptional regulator